MALLIGNGEYKRFPCKCCENSKYNYDNLTVSPNLRELKKLLEGNDFLVMAYIDLDDESFLRVIRLFKQKCSEAKNVLAFIYVGAHGYYNSGVYDCVLPVNFQETFHNSKHKFDVNYTNHLCLNKILENFVPSNDINETKFSVICFWDMCRENLNLEYLNVEDFDLKELKYMIIYCWYYLCYEESIFLINFFSSQIGYEAYEESSKGSIKLRFFLNELKKKKDSVLYNILNRVENGFYFMICSTFL